MPEVTSQPEASGDAHRFEYAKSGSLPSPARTPAAADSGSALLSLAYRLTTTPPGAWMQRNRRAVAVSEDSTVTAGGAGVGTSHGSDGTVGGGATATATNSPQQRRAGCSPEPLGGHLGDLHGQLLGLEDRHHLGD